LPNTASSLAKLHRMGFAAYDLFNVPLDVILWGSIFMLHSPIFLQQYNELNSLEEDK
jgi:hypothetical protein